MIYTVTLNPSLDYVMDLGALIPGVINRSSCERILPGGKGLNVSQVLAGLNVPSAAVYFAAGFTGGELTELLRGKGIETHPILLPSGMTRINVKVRAGEETALNASGPPVDAASLEALAEVLEAAGEGDVAVFSGSVPRSLPADIYARLAAGLRRRGAEVVIDAEGEALLRTLPLRPWFIKPNHEELGAVLGRPLRSPQEALAGAGILQARGARHVLVSMGAAGAVLLTEKGERLWAENPPGKAVNTVGAGDSMVAGFLAALLDGRSPAEALCLGVAAGSATAMADGLAGGEEIRALAKKVRLQK